MWRNVIDCRVYTYTDFGSTFLEIYHLDYGLFRKTHESAGFQEERVKCSTFSNVCLLKKNHWACFVLVTKSTKEGQIVDLEERIPRCKATFDPASVSTVIMPVATLQLIQQTLTWLQSNRLNKMQLKQTARLCLQLPSYCKTLVFLGGFYQLEG